MSGNDIQWFLTDADEWFITDEFAAVHALMDLDGLTFSQAVVELREVR